MASDEELRLLRDQIAALTSVVSRLSSAQDKGADRLFADLWALYERTWTAAWAANVRALMKQTVAHFGPLPMERLNADEWDVYCTARREKNTRLRKPPSTSSLNKELKRLKTFVRWCMARGHLASSKLLAVKPFPERPGRQTEIHDADLTRLLAKCSPVMRAFVLMAVDTGMRSSEIRTLTWRQIDLARGRVTCYWWKTKTRKERHPRLTERALEALKELPRGLHSPYVFRSPQTGGPYSKAWVWLQWRAACEAARLEPDDPADENVHLHDARHTFMSQAIRRGLRLPVAMKLSGHASLASAQRYLHVDEDDLDEAKRTLDEAIRKGPRKVVQEKVNAENLTSTK